MRKIRIGKRFLILAVGIVAALLILAFKVQILEAPGGQQAEKPDQTSEIKEPEFDKKQFSLSSPSSLWVVVNKQRSLPGSYVPDKLRYPNIPLRSAGSEMLLRDDVADALESMNRAAKKDGINLLLASGYRSYSLQQAVYNRFVKQDGLAAANRYSAKPGHSEHQTGLGLDVATTDGVCLIQECMVAYSECQRQKIATARFCLCMATIQAWNVGGVRCRTSINTAP